MQLVPLQLQHREIYRAEITRLQWCAYKTSIISLRVIRGVICASRREKSTHGITTASSISGCETRSASSSAGAT